MKKFLLVPLIAVFLGSDLFSQTITEKKLQSIQKREGEDIEIDSFLAHVNSEIAEKRSLLEQKYSKVKGLIQKGGKEEEYQLLLQEVNEIKLEISALEKKWRQAAVNESKREEEGYALWDQEETTLAQLVMEYGAMDFLYIIPPEIAALKLNMHSNIPIPRESWHEVLEIILAHNGIGVKGINAYTRQLFIMKQDPSHVEAIVSRPEELLLLSPQTRLFYVFTPPIEQAKSTFQFFERFSDAKQTFVYQVGGKIAMVSSKAEIEKLLSLYNTVWGNREGKISRVVPVSKMSAKEMEKILHSFFGDSIEKGKPPFGKPEQEGLVVHALGQGNSLVLMGQQPVVDRAEKIIKDTEEQLNDPSEMTVYLYTCRHSDPVDLAKVLEKVYSSLLTTMPESRESVDVSFAAQNVPPKAPDGYAPTPPLIVAPPPLKPGTTSQLEIEKGSENFIPDPKTGNLLMVVRRDALKKIKELLRKLDVPKKMVQIEVLLFEKQHNTENGFGFNLLKIGTKRNGEVKYTSNDAPSGPGVLAFLLKRHANHFPALELTYSFLMAQEDIQLNASPSVITVNQTPATITIVDEISINNGAAPVDTNKGIAFEKSFSRVQYGITIIINPTVHMPDDEVEGEEGFVTLQTNITFDTPKSHSDDRPPVLRRHIENEVRVVDGQTVILGGLRRKTMQDNEDKIPFLGEIPGFGKLFGSTTLTDHNTEMFFFITPTIILDPKEQMDRFRTEELKKRPGDIPEFLERLVEGRDKEKKQFFENSMKMFFSS